MTGRILELLVKYDNRMSFMFPDREWFFPSDYNPQEMHLQVEKARKHFNVASEIEKMLPYLSKHLGHSSIQETFTYYNHYEHDFEHIKKDSGYFDAMIPEVRDDD